MHVEASKMLQTEQSLNYRYKIYRSTIIHSNHNLQSEATGWQNKHKYFKRNKLYLGYLSYKNLLS